MPGNGAISVIIEYREVKTDEMRSNILKTQYDDLRNHFELTEATIINETRPNKTPPIPKTVSFAIQGKNTTFSTSDLYMMRTVIFSKNTYTVTAGASTQAEAKKLLDAIVKHID